MAKAITITMPPSAHGTMQVQSLLRSCGNPAAIRTEEVTNMATTIRVSGVGNSQEVVVESDEATISEALEAANIDVSGQGLEVKVNGAPVSLDASVENGDQVVTTPREVKLGS